MTTETYKAALQEARKHYEEAKERRQRAIEEQEEAENLIARLRNTVAALSAMCGEEFAEADEFGLTESIRMVLKTNPAGVFLPQDVKAKLDQMGFKTEKYTNILASIHTVLKRLVLKGEVDDNVTRDGKTAYRWNPVQPPPGGLGPLGFPKLSGKAERK